MPQRIDVTGPLAPLAAEFIAALVKAGYGPRAVQHHRLLAAHLSRWLHEQDLDVADLNEDLLQAFLIFRTTAGYLTPCARPSLRPLMDFLAARGLVTPTVPAPDWATDALVARFSRYLLDERAISPSTARLYGKRVKRFLVSVAPEGNLSGVMAAEVHAAVLAECEAVSAGSAQYFVTAIRSFLRFCYLEGLTEIDLSASALSVSGRRPSWLPKTISRDDVHALLATCDRSEPAGRRNYAILLLLARLGLRAGEVAALRLEDIDWRGGELLVRGKARRHDRLPLSVDVGEAIAAYLQAARPQALRREVFVSLSAPIRGLGYMAVSDVVRRTCDRAGVEPVGAHRLRHALAGELVAAGASLPEVGQLLRHRSFSATRIYGRVDVDLLRTIAQPWPAGASQ